MTPRGPIALDGPVASGKSTVGLGIARRLGWTFIDTGLLYRVVGLLALRIEPPARSDESLERIAVEAEMRIDSMSVHVNGEDVTALIHSAEVAQMASRVAELSPVRRALVTKQREMAAQAGGSVVMAGRDIGTVVLRDAPIKIYLDASPEARAGRRFEEERARGTPRTFTDVLADLRERDRRDAERADSPLRPAPDARRLVTDSLSVEQVIDRVLDHVRGN